MTKHKIKLNEQCFKCIETLKGNFHMAKLGGISDSKPTQQMPKIWTKTLQSKKSYYYRKKKKDTRKIQNLQNVITATPAPIVVMFS